MGGVVHWDAGHSCTCRWLSISAMRKLLALICLLVSREMSLSYSDAAFGQGSKRTNNQRRRKQHDGWEREGYTGVDVDVDSEL